MRVLLCAHDSQPKINYTYPSSPPIPRNTEKLPSLRENVLPLIDLTLKFHSDMCVIKIAASLQLCLTEPAEGFESLTVPALLDQPARRFGARVDLGADEDGKKDCRSKN